MGQEAGIHLAWRQKPAVSFDHDELQKNVIEVVTKNIPQKTKNIRPTIQKHK